MPAGRNTALVIGNGDYQYATRLESPHGDALAMASLLERLGFDVVAGFDCDFHDFERRLRDFQDRIDPAGVAVFYYSGHGVAELGEANHLLPVDAKVLYRDDLGRVTIPLDDVLTAMREAARVSLLFLDACRDDPFAGAVGELRTKRVFLPSVGLAAVPRELLNQALIAFAAEEGEVARDGDSGSLSPFTAALVQHLGSPGQEIRSVMTAVRRDVRTATANKQTPWSKESLTEDFVLVPAGETVAPQKPPEMSGGFVQRNVGAQKFLPGVPAAMAESGRRGQWIWLTGVVIVLMGAGGLALSLEQRSGGLCDKWALGFFPPCPIVTVDDIAELDSVSFARASDAADRLVQKLNGGLLVVAEKRDLAKSLVELLDPGKLKGFSLNGQRSLLSVLSQIPATTWQGAVWLDLAVQTQSQIANLDGAVRSGTLMLAPDSLMNLVALKGNLGYVNRATLTVYFQFAGYTRPAAEAFQEKLFSQGQWKVPGVEREAGASGLNEVRYGDAKLRVTALLLAKDVTTITGKTVTVAEIEPAIPALHLEIWISQ